MSFLKSYYNTVSSFLTSEEIVNDEIVEQEIIKEEPIDQSKVKESKSEGWLSGIYNTAYNSSGEMWKAVKTDLSEFATVVTKDAKTVVVKTANGVKHGLVGDDDATVHDSVDQSNSTTSKIKAGINRMLEQVSKTLYIPPESDDDDFYYNNDGESQTICSRIDTRIANLQRDKNTFIIDPNPSQIDIDLGDFTVWRETLNMDDFQSTIAELVKNNQYLLDNFTELVPDQVSFDDFWARYFYRIASVKAEESRREALKLRICDKENIVDNNDPGDWDEADDINEEFNALPNTTVVEPVSKEIVEFTDSNITELAEITKSDDELKMSEKNDVVVVQHLESSSASEDNNQTELSAEQKEVDDMACWDDDDLDVEVTEDDLELAKKVSDKDVLESKWEDWS